MTLDFTKLARGSGASSKNGFGKAARESAPRPTGRKEEHGAVFEILELEDYMCFGWKGIGLFLVVGKEEDDDTDCQKHDGVDKYHHGV